MKKLPEIIEHKQFKDKDLTKEQEIFNKVLSNEKLTSEEEAILDELIQFYESTFKELNEIDYASLSDSEYESLIEFLNNLYNVAYPVQNDLLLDKMYRVCIVNDSLREKGKIRHPKFISFPELNFIKERGNLNRANTSDYTVLYVSSNINIAIAEVKPQIGDKIIISYWEKADTQPINSYPVMNYKKETTNQYLKSSAEAMKQLYSKTHPKFAKIFDINLAFLADQFLKEVENGNDKGYEYSISSFYADRTLGIANIDCIIYPSIPFKYQGDNVALKPDNYDDYVNITNGISLKKVEECNVKSIDYSKMHPVDSFFELELIRDSDWIEQDDIIWSDD